MLPACPFQRKRLQGKGRGDVLAPILLEPLVGLSVRLGRGRVGSKGAQGREAANEDSICWAKALLLSVRGLGARGSGLPPAPLWCWTAPLATCSRVGRPRGPGTVPL